jgi:pyrroline-5-carboxylate reductase
VEKADVEVVFMGVQPQLVLVVLDEKAMRQEQHMISVQRKITCHVLHASIWLTMDRVAPRISIPLFAPCTGAHHVFFS